MGLGQRLLRRHPGLKPYCTTNVKSTARTKPALDPATTIV
jgi:hypothetical protein